jgi:hypothetical protein
MPVPIGGAEALNRKRDSFKQVLRFDFDLVLDTLDIAVSDSAERHAANLACRRMFSLSGF